MPWTAKNGKWRGYGAKKSWFCSFQNHRSWNFDSSCGVCAKKECPMVLLFHALNTTHSFLVFLIHYVCFSRKTYVKQWTFASIIMCCPSDSSCRFLTANIMLYSDMYTKFWEALNDSSADLSELCNVFPPKRNIFLARAIFSTFASNFKRIILSARRALLTQDGCRNLTAMRIRSITTCVHRFTDLQLSRFPNSTPCSSSASALIKHGVHRLLWSKPSAKALYPPNPCMGFAQLTQPWLPPCASGLEQLGSAQLRVCHSTFLQ